MYSTYFIKWLLGIVIVIIGILYQEKLESIYSNYFVKEIKPKYYVDGVFNAHELARYNGLEENKLYISVVGTIFDVTKGSQHYAKGASYHYFVGRDGSRALVTGNFEDYTEQRDHILDLSCDELSTIISFKDTFNKKYKRVGVLYGRYYNEMGKPTPYMEQLNIKLKECKDRKNSEKMEEIKFPPCNSAWDADTGTNVWCSKNSGGVSRSWVGMPRQFFTPGVDKPRCACIDFNADNSAALLKEYDNCPTTSSRCSLGNS